MLEPAPLPKQRRALFPAVIYHDRCQGPAEMGGGPGGESTRAPCKVYFPPHSGCSCEGALEMTTATKSAPVVLRGGGELPDEEGGDATDVPPISFSFALARGLVNVALLVLACFHRPRTTCYGACRAPTQMRARGNTGSPAAIAPGATPPFVAPRNRAGAAVRHGKRRSRGTCMRDGV